MKKYLLTVLALSAIMSVSAVEMDRARSKKLQPQQEHIENLPEAPQGYQWVVNEDFSDEFEGRKLNAKKWHAKSPYWTNGRKPATFKAECVKVGDGYLQITNKILDPSEGLDGKPGDRYTLAGGAVASVSDQAFYGYYECRMKASMTTMSSTFWLTNKGVIKDEVDADGNTIQVRHSQELDIIETMGVIGTLAKGDESWNKNWNKQMNSNTHYWRRGPGFGESLNAPRVDVVTDVTEASGEDFHTYGCWWIDANTVKFYFDGKYMYTIKPNTTYTDTPFSQPMFMHMVTETYDWEPNVPTAEVLENKEASTTLYDWVRSYKLEKIQH